MSGTVSDTSQWLAGDVSNALSVYGLVDTETFNSGVMLMFKVKATATGRLFLSRLDRDEDLRSELDLL